jgi:hypothetical protein
VVLARSLAAAGAPVQVLARQGDRRSCQPVPVDLIAGHGALPATAARLGLRSLVIQYVPFLYARRGVSPSLVLAVDRLARHGVAVVLVLHELFVPYTRAAWLVTGALQRAQLRLLLRRARGAFTAVPRWAEIVKGMAPLGVPVRLEAIGATLSPSRAGREEARAALGLGPGEVAVGVMSPSAAGYRSSWVAQAMRAAAQLGTVRWIVFGYGSDRIPFGEGGTAVRALGTLSAADLARTVRALDLLVAPYSDGLTMRRSSAMLALASGVPVVSSTGHLFDFRLSEFAACEPDAAAFAARVALLIRDPESRAALARRASDAGRVSSPATLAAAILDCLATPLAAA